MATLNKPLSVIVQAGLLKNKFPSAHVITCNGNQLNWIDTISPSPLGDLYRVKLVYALNHYPKVFVLSPNPLELAKGKKRLPHVYKHKEQQLCLFYPDGREWNKSLSLATTVIPWIYEWLYHYELWLGDGIWKGGGTHSNF